MFLRLDISSSGAGAALMKTQLLQTMLGRDLSRLVTSATFLSARFMLLHRSASAAGLYRSL